MFFYVKGIKIAKEDNIMVLKNINLINFRNYESMNIDLSDGINIIYGDNAQGKTNLLESIYVLALTKSHRSFIDNNLIKNGSTSSKIKGKIEIDKIKTNLEVILENRNKNLKVDNNQIKKVSDYISIMNIIIFYPEDLELIKGSPAERRKYVNIELSQINKKHLEILSDYNKLLKMRNETLKKINIKQIEDTNYLEVLNQKLIDKAILLYRLRKRFIDEINERCGTIYKNISGFEGFKLEYKTQLKTSNFSNESIKEELIEKYKNSYKTELKLGLTLNGPHRDDIEFYLDNTNLKTYGSQGQQRIAILALKLSEIEIFKSYKNTSPILLLDDVFSELDDKKKNNLLYYIDEKIQTIITTTDLKNIKKSIVDKAKLFKIKEGKIINKE